MGLFDFFSGKRPEDIEKKGDELFDRDAFGYAKIEYEKARERHLKKPSTDGEFAKKIDDKIQKACEGLACGHKDKAERYIKLNCFEDALELVELAMLLTRDNEIRNELIRMKAQILLSNNHANIESGFEDNIENDFKDGIESDFEDGIESDIETDIEIKKTADVNEIGNTEISRLEETFFALCNTLDENEQEEYHAYGEEFMLGFVALNEGDFFNAEEHLLNALEKNSDRTTHIPLELAVCYLNMGEYAKSRIYAESCLDDFPESENGCRIMCEAFWAEGDYQGAHNFLDHIMPANRQYGSIVFSLLKGDTFFQAGEYQKAETFFLEHLKKGDAGQKDQHLGQKDQQTGQRTEGSEQNELILRSLARTCQAMGEHHKARDIYAGLMSRCSGCGRMSDFALRKGFAESSFASGVHTTQILEIFLQLVQEDPENRGAYYLKVSDIYAVLDHDEESLRFKAMAQDV